jgi:hypothetical protein
MSMADLNPTIPEAETTRLEPLLGALEGSVSVPDDLMDADHADLWNVVSADPHC